MQLAAVVTANRISAPTATGLGAPPADVEVAVERFPVLALRAYDVDHDGSISLAREGVQRGRGYRSDFTFDVTALVRGADLLGDSDGAASGAELLRLAASFDADQDGWLTATEAGALHRAFPVHVS